VREQAGAAVVQRHAGFVTGCFNAKYDHEASQLNRVVGL